MEVSVVEEWVGQELRELTWLGSTKKGSVSARGGLCGAGVVGIALAGAGAEVVLTDLPHILHLTQQNLEANLKAYHRARVRSRPLGSPSRLHYTAFDCLAFGIRGSGCIGSRHQGHWMHCCLHGLLKSS